MDRVWTVDFWFDPSCPLTRNTARWLLEASDRRPITITWRVMSLSVLNEGRDDDPEGDPDGYLWIPARICAAVQHEHGHDALGRFYRALWSAAENGDGDWIGGFAEALAAAGLPPELAAAGEGTDYDGVLRASHEEGTSLVGEGTGTPVTAVTAPDGGRTAFFGPVVHEVPTGPSAADLWDGALLIAGVPGFRELKT
ncbi:mycothiol-dependent nitroreductase Rv2466c family protein [Nocardiopsis chromatogenes]|uniref:mycothiol-dependent nitroreductase Rv2466c family protein n=1 Tax=Nocardiopsis chromatogenes TaxID=280239 RepID=UPI000368FAA9|nr:hypothetical protein [Nocardiopsis chromatogenes]